MRTRPQTHSVDAPPAGGRAEDWPPTTSLLRSRGRSTWLGSCYLAVAEAWPFDGCYLPWPHPMLVHQFRFELFPFRARRPPPSPAAFPLNRQAMGRASSVFSLLPFFYIHPELQELMIFRHNFGPPRRKQPPCSLGVRYPGSYARRDQFASHLTRTRSRVRHGPINPQAATTMIFRVMSAPQRTARP